MFQSNLSALKSVPLIKSQYKSKEELLEDEADAGDISLNIDNTQDIINANGRKNHHTSSQFETVGGKNLTTDDELIS